MLNNVLGTKFKVVFGYSGTPEVTLAIQKGEIHGMCGLGWSSLKAQYPDLLKNGTVKIAVQVNDKGLPELNKMGVPLTVAYAHDEQQRRILEIFYSQQGGLLVPTLWRRRSLRIVCRSCVAPLWIRGVIRTFSRKRRRSISISGRLRARRSNPCCRRFMPVLRPCFKVPRKPSNSSD